MKKIGLLVSLVIMCVVRVSAQEVDSLQSNPTNETIETLSAKVKKLENDYTYLEFNNLLLESICSVEDLHNDILINYNTITITCFHDRYYEDLYIAWKNCYDAYIISLNNYHETVESVKMILSDEVFLSKFSNVERDYLNLKYQKLEQLLSQVKRALDLYKIALEKYKGKDCSLY